MTVEERASKERIAMQLQPQKRYRASLRCDRQLLNKDKSDCYCWCKGKAGWLSFYIPTLATINCR